MNTVGKGEGREAVLLEILQLEAEFVAVKGNDAVQVAGKEDGGVEEHLT